MKFQVVNIGLIISLIINFVISFVFICVFTNDILSGVVITAIIFIISIGILYTPIGDWWYRCVALKLRGPNDSERKRLEPIFNEVYNRALKESPKLSKNIKLYIYDDDDINAFAVGMHTIAVHRGLLTHKVYDKEIAAILGHEFAHIANGDTFCTILAVQSNCIVSIIRTIVSVLILATGKILGFIVSLAFSSREGAEAGFVITDACIRGINWLLDKFVYIFVCISVIIAQYSRRRNELEADSYSVRLGYGLEMIKFFERFSNYEKTYSFSLSQLLYGTHPSTQVRISNITNQMNTKQLKG